jgi:hypothetical protein
MRKIALIVIVLCVASSCAARRGAGNGLAVPFAPGDPWQRVEALDKGTRVEVCLTNGERLRGELRSAESGGITLASGKSGEKAIARSDIQELRLRRSDWKGPLIGAAAGAGGGALLAWGVSERIDVTTGLTVPILAGAGAGVGALVGYLVTRRGSGDTVLFSRTRSAH